MSYKRYAKGFLISTCLAMMSCSVVWAVPQESGNAEAQENPFASVLRKQQYAATDTTEMSAGYDTAAPEISAETVKLSYVDAKTASEAFSCLSSEVGRIVAQEQSNSLIVFDTPENIEKIVAEIKKADRPIESLTLQYVDLTFMDANAVAEAISRTASAIGSIISVAKTNGLILCDTRLNVESMVKEIKRLDQPMAGMQIEPIVFQSIAAASAKEALSNLLSAYGIISIVERTNSIVVCDLPKNLESIRKEALAIDKKTPGVTIEIVNLKFLEATNVVTVLAKMVSQYGSVAANTETNTIIICDTEENTAKIVSEIKKVDKTPPQIMVEVVLLDVLLADDKEIGVNWEMFTSNYRRRINGIYDADDSDTTLAWDAETNVGVGTSFDTINGGVLDVLNGTVSAMVTAIQTTRDVKVIASPRALMLSGKTASITAAEQIPYNTISETSQGGSMTATSFAEAGVTLEVTATVIGDGEILLVVKIEQNVRTGESLGGVPVIDSRNEDTSLLLDDGQIVVMGGLRRRETTIQVTKVPLLGDLPILGGLFRNKQDVISNSELVVLLSPHIYTGRPMPKKVMGMYEELKQKAPLTGEVSKQ